MLKKSSSVGLIVMLAAAGAAFIGVAFLASPFLLRASVQSTRDIGAVRLWADTLVEAGNRITATGNIQIGPANTDQRWFSVTSRAVFVTGTNRITLAGQLAIVGSSQLISGEFPVNTASGVLTVPASSAVLYRKLGDSNVAITPTFSINMLQPEVDASAQVDVVLPEGALRPNIQFRLGFNGRITGTAVVPINLRLAGGLLTATAVISQSGLYAPSVQYSIDGITTTLSDLVVDGQGDLKLRFGAAVDFPIPDLDAGDGFFRLTQVRGRLGLRLGAGNQPLGYEVALQGRLRLDRLPENSSVTANGVSLKFSNGVLSGGVESFAVTYSGNKLRFAGVSFSTAASSAAAPQDAALDRVAASRRVLLAQNVDYELPPEWRPVDEVTPTVHLQSVAIQSTPPYIVIGGVGISFVIGKDYYLGGSATSANSIRLSGIQGRVDYSLQNNRWSTSVTATVSLRMGDGVTTSVTGNLTTDSTGKFAGRIVNIALGVAGAQLSVSQINFQANVFTAGSATLSLPQGFGSVTVNNIRIDQNGISLAGGAFTLPDISFNALRLTQNSGVFRVGGANTAIEVTSTLRVEGGASPVGGGTGVLVRGNLKIRNGRVTGALDQFGFILSGAEFRLTNPRFLDNRITADQASLSIPTGGGAVTASANGIEIGGAAGFKFRQPTIQMSDFVIAGIGIQNPHLTFSQGTNGNFTLTGGAVLQFTQFSVAGDFTITRRNNALEFSPVHLEFRATPGIPLGQTGFELTRITGDFNLSQGTAVIQLGVRIESQVKVIIPIVSMDGTITLQVLPSFDLRARAGVQIVGITVSTADLHITPRAATLNGTLEYQVARQIVDLSFGLDANRQFTLFGSMRSELGLRQGSLVHWCVPFVGCADVPPFDYTLASVTYDAGKFRDLRPDHNSTVWGGRTQFTVFGQRAYAFLRLAPTPVDIIVGTDLDDYRPVTATRSTLAANPATARLAAGALDADAIAVAGVRQFEITRPAELLVFAEVVTPSNIGLPLPPLQALSPHGESFVLQPTHTQDDGSFRLFALNYPTPTEAIGTWTTSVMPGNVAKMWGQKPGIRITRFSASFGYHQAASPAGADAATLSNGDPVQFDIEAVRSEPGMAVQLYAQAAGGGRFPILDVADTTTSTLRISRNWVTNLPGGWYTLTVVADAFGSSIDLTDTLVIEVVDTTPPPAPSGLSALAQVDGSVRLAWTADTTPDLEGYQFSADGEPPVPAAGAREAYGMHGLAPGGVHTLTVRAYDSSGNVGAAAGVTVEVPLFRLESVAPFPGSLAMGARAVAAAFNAPVLDASLALVDAQGYPIAGSTTSITVEQDVDRVDVIGAQLALGAALPAGVYTATVQAHTLEGQPVQWEWSFAADIYHARLPVVIR